MDTSGNFLHDFNMKLVEDLTYIPWGLISYWLELKQVASMKAWNTDSKLGTLVHFPRMEIERPFQRPFLPREGKSKAWLAQWQNDFMKLEAVTFLEN